MSVKAAGVQIVRKEEEEKPTTLEAFLAGFLLLSLVLGPLMIAFTIMFRLWEDFGTTDSTGIYLGFILGLLISAGLGFIFMKYATR